MNPLNLITLTTDFGLYDTYVGQIKGAILKKNIQAGIIDLTHEIEAHNILTAAISIHSSYRYFPLGTVHIVVVDPGVGSKRNILALKSDNHIFIAPDNGTLTYLMQHENFEAAHIVSNRTLCPGSTSSTFHGRDIMAPVAAAVAGGMKIDEVGPEVKIKKCVQLDIPKSQLNDNGINGKVLHIDRFGNIKTTITSDDICHYKLSSFGGIVIGSHTIKSMSTTYSDSAKGELIAIIDSAGHLEIAANQAQAAQIIGCSTGTPVFIAMEKE